MNYPTLEQYTEAMQSPQLALIDPELKRGTVATTGLGMPLALCGGFALTYTISTGGKKYAVRCFHKKSSDLEKRYSAISNRLKALNSPYFIDFAFQLQGIRVNSVAFPVVKMAWASGATLGEFVEGRYRAKLELQQLAASLRTLAAYLEKESIAHGDIQPGNVMVANSGKSLQLIDYDGMFVDDLKGLGSAELGHRNFQHPGRATNTWNVQLDRFSFIALNLALRVLEAQPDLWAKTQSDSDAILFKANDFNEPGQSDIFRDLFARSQFAEEAKALAAICASTFDKVPTLEDFLARRNIPPMRVAMSAATSAKLGYMAAYPVLDAANYALCLRHVGDRVELIGKIVEVKQDQTRYGKPYIFINFGPWRGEIVKITIWSEGLATLAQRPNAGWVGRWISVVGLMEPPYCNHRYKYSHLSITITQGNQIHTITEAEAKFRLSGTSSRLTGQAASIGNKEILDGIRGNSPSVTGAVPASRTPTSSNQAILMAMQGNRLPAASSTSKLSQPLPSKRTSSSTATSSQPVSSANKTVRQTIKNSQPPQPAQPSTKSRPKARSSSDSGCSTMFIIGVVLFVLWLIGQPH